MDSSIVTQKLKRAVKYYWTSKDFEKPVVQYRISAAWFGFLYSMGLQASDQTKNLKNPVPTGEGTPILSPWGGTPDPPSGRMWVPPHLSGRMEYPPDCRDGGTLPLLDVGGKKKNYFERWADFVEPQAKAYSSDKPELCSGPFTPDVNLRAICTVRYEVTFWEACGISFPRPPWGRTSLGDEVHYCNSNNWQSLMATLSHEYQSHSCKSSIPGFVMFSAIGNAIGYKDIFLLEIRWLSFCFQFVKLFFEHLK